MNALLKVGYLKVDINLILQCTQFISPTKCTMLIIY